MRHDRRIGIRHAPLDEFEHVVSVPLNVEDSEGLYLRTVEDDGDFYRLDIPPGQYDVVARFYPTKDKDRREGDSDDAFLPHCKLALTFLPRGTVEPRVFKVAYGEWPSRLMLRGEDGNAAFVPNSPTPKA